VLDEEVVEPLENRMRMTNSIPIRPRTRMESIDPFYTFIRLCAYCSVFVIIPTPCFTHYVTYLEWRVLPCLFVFVCVCSFDLRSFVSLFLCSFLVFIPTPNEILHVITLLHIASFNYSTFEQGTTTLREDLYDMAMRLVRLTSMPNHT